MKSVNVIFMHKTHEKCIKRVFIQKLFIKMQKKYCIIRIKEV